MAQERKIKDKDKDKDNGQYSMDDVLSIVGQLAQEVKNQQVQIQQMLDSQNGEHGEGIDDESDKAGARVKLVDHMYNTPDQKLPELTVTPLRMVVPMAIEAAWNEYLERVVRGGDKPLLLDIFMRKLDQRMRSVDGRWSTDALVMSQTQEEGEAARSMDEGGGL